MPSTCCHTTLPQQLAPECLHSRGSSPKWGTQDPWKEKTDQNRENWLMAVSPLAFRAHRALSRGLAAALQPPRCCKHRPSLGRAHRSHDPPTGAPGVQAGPGGLCRGTLPCFW